MCIDANRLYVSPKYIFRIIEYTFKGNMNVYMTTLLVVLIGLMLVLLYYIVSYKRPLSKYVYVPEIEGYNGSRSPEYTNQIRLKQIYKDIYFDVSNGNVLDLSFNESLELIDIRRVYDRDAGNEVPKNRYNVSNDDISANSTNSTSTASFYNYYSYTTAKNVQIFYCSWDKATYIHVIDLQYKATEASTPAPHHVASFCYDPSADPKEMITTHTNPLSPISINTTSYSLSITDNKNMLLKLYDKSKNVMKLKTNVYYDWTNGSLILKTANGINVHARSASSGSSSSAPAPTFTNNDAGEGSGTSTTINSVGFVAWKFDFENFIIIYFGNGKKTVTMILYKATNSDRYTGLSAVRFSNNGSVDDGTSTSTITTQNPLDSGSSDSGTDGTSYWFDKNNPLSDYYRWAAYWNGLTDISGSDWRRRNDLLLKTQIVPPVCPRCPSCPNSGVCTTCGGNGGSGTQKSEGGSLLRDAGSGTTDLLRDAGSGAKDLLEDTASGVKDVAYDVAGGAKDVAYDVVGGTKDVVSDVAGEAKDVVSDIYGGIRGALQGKPTDVKPLAVGGDSGNAPVPMTATGRGYGINVKVPNTQGSDFMTYFGALQPKGESEYIPVTADFSAFRR